MESRHTGVDDTDWIERAANGDDRALEHLIERCLPVARAFVRRRMGSRLRTREESLDLVQSACRRALERRHAYQHRGEPQFRAWLLEIVENKIVDRYRELQAARRNPDVEIPLETRSEGRAGELGLQASPSSPVSIAERRERAERLHRALELLSEEHAQAIRLHEFESLPYEKVAQRMGLTLKQGRLRVLQAKLELAQALRCLDEDEANRNSS